MTKRMRVFLPRWVLWFIVPLLAVIWGIVTYAVFATAEGRAELGVFGWLGITAVFILVGAMMWLMTGRLPAYIIELENEDDKGKR